MKKEHICFIKHNWFVAVDTGQCILYILSFYYSHVLLAGSNKIISHMTFLPTSLGKLDYLWSCGLATKERKTILSDLKWSRVHEEVGAVSTPAHLERQYVSEHMHNLLVTWVSHSRHLGLSRYPYYSIFSSFCGSRVSHLTVPLGCEIARGEWEWETLVCFSAASWLFFFFFLLFISFQIETFFVQFCKKPVKGCSL